RSFQAVAPWAMAATSTRQTGVPMRREIDFMFLIQSSKFRLTNRLATTINAELAEPAEKTGSVLRVLRFLR
ncbi:MAG: hypothetical protein DMF97_14340, partial [Acidobacteria bacterium]